MECKQKSNKMKKMMKNKDKQTNRQTIEREREWENETHRKITTTYRHIHTYIFTPCRQKCIRTGINLLLLFEAAPVTKPKIDLGSLLVLNCVADILGPQTLTAYNIPFPLPLPFLPLVQAWLNTTIPTSIIHAQIRVIGEYCQPWAPSPSLLCSQRVLSQWKRETLPLNTLGWPME